MFKIKLILIALFDCEEWFLRIFAVGSHCQSACLQRDLATFVLLSKGKKTIFAEKGKQHMLVSSL